MYGAHTFTENSLMVKHGRQRHLYHNNTLISTFSHRLHISTNEKKSKSQEDRHTVQYM